MSRPTKPALLGAAVLLAVLLATPLLLMWWLGGWTTAETLWWAGLSVGAGILYSVVLALVAAWRRMRASTVSTQGETGQVAKPQVASPMTTAQAIVVSTLLASLLLAGTALVITYAVRIAPARHARACAATWVRLRTEGGADWSDFTARCGDWLAVRYPRYPHL